MGNEKLKTAQEGMELAKVLAFLALVFLVLKQLQGSEFNLSLR